MRLYSGFVGLLWLLLGTGCAVVTSTVPYYTEQNKVEVPAELCGSWIAESPEKLDRKTVRLELLPDGTATVHEFAKEEPGKAGETVFNSKFQVWFFRVDGVLYADGLLQDIPGAQKLGTAAVVSLVPGHVLLKIVPGEDSFRLFYPEELPKVLKAGTLPPEFTVSRVEETPGKETGYFVCTAPGSVWEKVLKERSADLFSSKPEDEILFKRVQVK
mgnify:CR=1 FL=1